MSFFVNENQTLEAAATENSWSQGDKTGFKENLKAAYNYMVMTELSTSERNNLMNKYGEIIDTARGLGHTNLTNPFVDEPMESEAGGGVLDETGGFESEENRISAFHQKLNELQKTDFNLAQALKEKGIDTREGIEQQIKIDINESFNKFLDVKRRSTGKGTVGSFFGMGGAIFKDPLIQATIPISMGYSIPRNFLAAAGKIAYMEAIIAATAETAIQYGAGASEYRERMGLDGEGLKRIGYATVAGALGGPLLFGFFKGIGKTIDVSKQGLGVVRSKLEDLPIQRLRAMYREMAKKNPQFATKNADNFKPEQFTEETPFEVTPAGNSEHVARSNEVMDLVNGTGKIETLNEPTIIPVKPKDIKDYNADIKTYDPDDLSFDPQTFQYKLDGDAEGVSNKLKDVTEWDQPSAGVALVYEYRDGRKVIVDGHQRLGLAKRLKLRGQEPKLPAYTFKEADGIIPDQVMVKGMLMNLRNNTGSAVDAARVMRSDYQVDWNKVKASLPPRSKLVKNAFGLSKLSDDAWGLFLNKNVNEDLASLVGSILDNKKIHNKVLASLMNRRFNNLTEMENVINSIKNSAVVKSQQETLFGTDFIEESLFIEKAQLVSYVTSNKKRLKQAFQTIVKSDKDLSAAGNILKKEQNIEQGIENAKILEKLNTLSTRVGKLSDDLNASAKILKEGNVAEARQSAQEAIQRAVERGDFDRNFVSGPIRDNAVETPTRTISKIEKPEVNQRTIEEAKSFDDIQNNTKGIEKQTNDYDNQFFGEELQQPKGRTEINTEEQKLVDEIKNADPTDANVQKYENSSLYKNKLEEAKKFEINTNERPGYVADETADFWKTRDYGNFGVGLENFIKKFYGSGAAKKEKKLVIVMGPTASGKSSVINKDYKNYGAYLADSDEIKKVLPEFEGGLNANGVHPESSFINTRILERAAQNGDNIIYPTTGREASKLNNVITEFEKAGYNIEVVNVKINANEAKLRNIARTFTGNRVISNNLLDEKTLKKIENNYINIKDEYKSKQIDNSQRTSTKDVEGLQDSRSRILLKNFEEEIEQVAQRLDPETKIPGNRIINQETGETQVEEITIRSMLDDEAQDTALINRMKDCV